MLSEKPTIFLGVDIGLKRDTCAVAGVYRDVSAKKIRLWGHMIWDPAIVGTVHLPTVTDGILKMIENERIAGIWYDNYQFVGETQRITDAGYGRLIHDVNQQTENVAFSNNLSDALGKDDLVMYPDAVVRSHFAVTGARITERGFRIEKRHQSKPIDSVLAIAMALYGCTQDVSYLYHQSGNTEEEQHRAEALP